MSDSDDGFDKEAAREELREKYENEREDREATARMSELLLQGATMTNDHCDRCGTPLFRQSGQTFCPTCQHDAQQASQQPDGDQPTAAAGDGQQPADATQSDQPTPADAQTATPQHDQRAPRDQQAQQPAADATANDPQRREDAANEADRPTRSAGRDARARDLPEHAPTAERRADAGEAADALDSSIAALARRAASADDPRTAREYLEAAREAAEALAALR